MLPDIVYRALPYAYIFAGVVCPMIFESEIIYVSSVLLVFTGFIVFWMRYGGGAKYSPAKRGVPGSSGMDAATTTTKTTGSYQKTERRHSSVKREFPIINNNGEIIAYDRRLG